jgi:hypothetical protein
VKFDLSVMREVALHYASQKIQILTCPDCQFQAWDDDERYEYIPDGWEPVRGENMLVQQCEVHDKPLRPWLAEANPDKAAEWLVEQSEGKKVFQADFEAWEKALAPAP